MFSCAESGGEYAKTLHGAIPGDPLRESSGDPRAHPAAKGPQGRAGCVAGAGHEIQVTQARSTQHLFRAPQGLSLYQESCKTVLQSTPM